MTDTSVQSAESLPETNQQIDATSLFKAALAADEAGQWGNDGAFEMPDKPSEPSGDRATDEGGEEATKDKAEPSAEQKTEQQLRDEKGRFKAKAPEAQEPAQQQPDDSKYAKAKKEESRQRSLLADFEKHKQELRQQQAEFERTKAEFEQRMSQFQQIPRQKDGTPYEFNSKQYQKAADDFWARGKQALASGDYEEAQKAFTQAEQCAAAADQVAQAEYQSTQGQQQKQLVQTWEAHRDAYLSMPENKDAAWNDENPTPLNLEIKNLLEAQGNEFLHYLPHGFSIAAQVAKWKIGAAEASALSEKVKQLEAENSDLRQRTGIRPNQAFGGIPAAKTPDSMSEGEKRSWLRGLAAEYDNLPAY